ncbi:hypothetical protein NM208_g13753 [Fusarium decemcellulare]|uniref:Uncharacterized protein n=1 Tax=Fusarium decemcellulare TaxID=57161 RepID=A0ACC1RIK6_9HYPO|nr:hypothetical protein NM208_g13753 [Fusarium decemcellulare]
MKTFSALFRLASVLLKVTSGAYSTVPSRTDPNHGLRWKRLEDGQIWYHSAESHTDSMPVMVWLQGGPGGSLLAGMFTENGPCLVKYDRNETAANDRQASYPSRAEDSAIDFVHALRILLEAFPELGERSVYLSGESYAVCRSGLTDSLASIAVGNPLTNAFEQVPSIYDISCHKHHNIEPALNRTSCDKLARFVNGCELRALQCQETRDSLVCYEASLYCAANFWTALDGTSVNKYNRVQRCGGDCYPDMDWIDQWMNFEEQRSILELDEQTVGSVTPVRYTSLNWDVFTRLNMPGATPARTHTRRFSASAVMLPVL